MDQRRDDLREALDAFLNGETGIRFEALATFAEPLFDLYEVDPRETLTTLDGQRATEEAATLLSVLEMARLLWAYCGLTPEEQATHLPALCQCLLGPQPTDEALQALDDLLEMMQQQWDGMDPFKRAAAEDMPGFAVPSLAQLLADMEDADGPSRAAAADAAYPTESFDLPEAFAHFVQPLLDDPRVHADAERLEDVMARAQAYWELAQVPGDEYEERLCALVKLHAPDPAARHALRVEAERMVQHFFALFPDRRPGTL